MVKRHWYADIDGLAWFIVAIIVLFWAVAVGMYAGGAWATN